MKISVIVAAAGSSVRLGGDINKPLLDLAGKPVVARSLDTFSETAAVEQIIITAAACDIEKITAIAKDYPKVTDIVQGGDTRQQSVAKALALVDEDSELVAVHDAARPLLSRVDWLYLLSAAANNGSVILAGPLVDSIKSCARNMVCESLDRNKLVAAQTPQVFRRSYLVRAYEQAAKDNFSGTDDASLVEHLGIPVAVIMAKNANFKITYADDLVLAEMIIKRRMG